MIRAAYAFLIIAAFLVGRFFTGERREDESASVVERPSILLSGQEAQAISNTDSESKDVAESREKTMSTDGFAEKVAEMLEVGVKDYGAFSDVVEAWVDRDPLGAIYYLNRGESRVDMLRWIVSIWGREHPEDASRWLAENDKLAGLDHAIEGLTQGIQKDDPESAMEWAKMIYDPSVRTRVLAASGFQSYRHDHNAAAEALADSGLPTDAQEAIKKSWADTWKSAAKRNSQNVSSAASAAQAAGVEFDTSSIEAFVKQIREGVQPESGPFKDSFFGVPNLTMLEGEAVLKHLLLKNEVLAYTPGDE